MDDLTGTFALFDLGQTLASVTLTAGGDRIAELRVYPDVPGLLAGLRERGTRLGLLSDPGPIPADEVDRALRDAGLAELLEPELTFYRRKDSPRPFREASAAAGDPSRRVFVGEDARERAHAGQAGYLVAPHPRLAREVLEHAASLRYVRVSAPPARVGREWRDALRDPGVLPLHGADATSVFAVATAGAAARLDDLGLGVDRLGAPGAPDTSDLYLLRDDRRDATGLLAPGGNSVALVEAVGSAADVLASTADGLVVAVPADRTVGSLHFTGARHGHNLKLRPSVAWFAPVEERASAAPPAARSAPASVGEREKEILSRHVRPEDIEGHVARYSGTRPAGPGGALITSRHVEHADNAVAVATLEADLGSLGLAVRRHRFGHQGLALDNVEAELPGRGLDGVVLVTAHLDSTAARGFGYDPPQDPAPGADDDASGVAGVLAAASAITCLDRELGVDRRAVRFVLFNAEEDGLVGSHAYAFDQRSDGAPIVGVLQLDMIGWDVLPERAFEVHAGYPPSSEVQERSLALAATIDDLVGQVSPDLPAPQMYPAPGEFDLAHERSDHTSFQHAGYAACLTSEDLFAGPGPGAPPEEMNPQYHMATDTEVNTGYAADIARLVAAAAWVLATR